MTPDRFRMREYIHDSTQIHGWSDEERMRVRDDLDRMYRRALDGRNPLDESLLARATDAAHAERVSSAMQEIERYALRDLDPHTASKVDEVQQRYEMTQQSRAAWTGGERMGSRDADAFQDYERNRYVAAAERASAYDERDFGITRDRSLARSLYMQQPELFYHAEQLAISLRIGR